MGLSRSRAGPGFGRRTHSIADVYVLDMSDLTSEAYRRLYSVRNILRFLRPQVVAMFPADENIWFHRQVAYSMAFWSVIHTTGHYIVSFVYQ